MQSGHNSGVSTTAGAACVRNWKTQLDKTLNHEEFGVLMKVLASAERLCFQRFVFASF